MILYLITIWVVSHFYDRFESGVRSHLWSQQTKTPDDVLPLLKQSLMNQFQQLNELNLVVGSSLDWQLKLISFRELFIRFCLSRVAAVTLLGLLFLSWGSFEMATIIALLIGGVCFWQGRAWTTTLFPVVYFSLAWWVGGFGLELLKRAYTSDPESSIWFFLADGRFPYVLTHFLLSFVISFLIRKPGLLVLIASPLFFSGFISVIHWLALLFGEILAISLIARGYFKKDQKLIRKTLSEMLIIKFLCLGFLILFWMYVKSFGLLDVRVFGNLWDKKTTLIIVWFASEVLLTMILMLWGHFRYKSLQPDPSQILAFSSVSFPLKRFRFSHRQLRHWYDKAAEKKKALLEQIENQLIPQQLRAQGEKEVEALTQFIELVKPNN